MMKWVFLTIIAAAVIFGAVDGNIGAVSSAALSECESAVMLTISIGAIICLWSGIMRVAEKAGIVTFLARLFSPLLSLLFRGLDRGGKAMNYIVLNITANLLGLGNASTPFGIAALREMEKEEKTGETASDNMVTFVVMNTASLQLIPTTAAALRLKNGSAAPMEILPAVWAVSFSLLICTITASKLFARLKRFGKLRGTRR